MKNLTDIKNIFEESIKARGEEKRRLIDDAYNSINELEVYTLQSPFSMSLENIRYMKNLIGKIQAIKHRLEARD